MNGNAAVRPVSCIAFLALALSLGACGGPGALVRATPVASASPAQVSAPAAACPADRLGTSRTLTLKREYAAYGTVQHAPLPLAKGEVVLTFDDGPRPETTPRVLDALADQCVRATFFMVGQNLVANPELGRMVASKGHATASHSFRHPQLGQLTPEEQLKDLEQGIQAYAAAFGSTPPAYRFPFLGETPTVLDALKAKHMTVMSVDLGIDDWAPNDMSTDAMVRRLMDNLDAKGGGIILMHDANGPTGDALPAMLKAIRDKGYKVVHVRWQDTSEY